MKIILFLLVPLTADFFQFVQSVEDNERNILEAVKMVGCPEDELCWPKCCRAHQYYETESSSCLPTNNSDYLQQPDVYELSLKMDLMADLKLLPPRNLPILGRYGRTLYSEICNTSLNLVPLPDKAKFLSKGKLYFESSQEWKVYVKGFCMENIVNATSGDHFVSAFICSDNSSLDHYKPSTKRVACRDVLNNTVN